MLAVLLAACAGGSFGPHGKAALLLPPLPYDARAEAAGVDPGAADRRGLAAYPNFAPGLVGDDFHARPDPDALRLRNEAYGLMTKACEGSVLIWREDSLLSASERALAAAQGVCMPHNDRVWALRFSCGPPQHGGADTGGGNGAGATAKPSR